MGGCGRRPIDESGRRDAIFFLILILFSTIPNGTDGGGWTECGHAPPFCGRHQNALLHPLLLLLLHLLHSAVNEFRCRKVGARKKKEKKKKLGKNPKKKKHRNRRFDEKKTKEHRIRRNQKET